MIDPAVAGGGEGHTQATHAIGALLWFTGLVPQSVFAYMNAMDTKLDVVDGIVVRFTNGAIGTITANGMQPAVCSANHLHIEGEGGNLHIALGDFGKLTVQMRTADMQWSTEMTEFIDINAAQVGSFVRTILGQEPLRVEPEVPLNEVRLLDAAYRSAASGQPVTVAS